MSMPVYDVSGLGAGVPVDQTAEGVEPSEPLYEPPGYLPSFLPSSAEDAMAAPTAAPAAVPLASFPAPVAAPRVVTPAAPEAPAGPSMSEFLQNLPAPTQPAQARQAAVSTAVPAQVMFPNQAPAADAAAVQQAAALAEQRAAEAAAARAAQEAQEAQEAREAKAAQEAQAAREAQEAQALHELKLAQEAQAAQELRAAQDAEAARVAQVAAQQAAQDAAAQAEAQQAADAARQAAEADAAAQQQAAQQATQIAAQAAADQAAAEQAAAQALQPPTPAAVHPAPALSDLPGPVMVPHSEEIEDYMNAAQPTVFEGHRDSRLSPDPALDEALQRVLMTSGSDLHVSAGAPPMIRVDGALRPIEGAAVWDHERVSRALYSLLTPEQQAIFEEHLEFDFAYTLSANARFRVNFYLQRNTIGAAFRLIPTEIKPLSALGVPDSIASFAKLPRGLVLVTGPTGSGKSTTLASLIDLVNRTRTDHIMTVEDPIEFLHVNHKSLVNQREVGHDTHSFAAALKHVLRQDPDVILVGELRDLETISVALTAAETGHLVFATLHTQSAAQTIDRIIDVYPPHQQGQVRAQLASTLQGVVCQTLVKRANGRGRVVATEVLMATHAVANLIREGKTYQVPSAMQAGRELGMHTLDQHLADLVNSGQITFAAAVEKSQDVEVLKRLVTRADTVTAVGANMASQGMNFSDAYSGQL